MHFVMRVTRWLGTFVTEFLHYKNGIRYVRTHISYMQTYLIFGIIHIIHKYTCGTHNIKSTYVQNLHRRNECMCTIRHNTTQHNTTQHNTTQHNTTQHNTTQHNTTWYNTIKHCLDRNRMRIPERITKHE